MQMAETVAMGRALANFGYGTEELADDDVEELADSPVPSSATIDARGVFDAEIMAELAKYTESMTERVKIFTEATGYPNRGMAWSDGSTSALLVSLIDSYMGQHLHQSNDQLD